MVDDNQLWVKAICFKLARSGYKMLTAQDGAEAISVVRKEKPDLALLDVAFPSEAASAWDGFGIMEWLHRLDESRKLPIIIFTGDDDAKIEERALNSGAAGFFHKPINHDELISAIQRVLKTAGPNPA